MYRLALLACLVLAGWAAAGEEASLARYLPPETLVYFEARNPLPKELEGTVLARIFRDPRMRVLRERSLGEESSISNMKVSLGRQRGLTVHSDALASPSVEIRVKYVDERGERRFTVQNRLAFAWVGFIEGGMPLDLVAALEVDTDPKEAAETIERIAAAVALHVRGDKKTDVETELARLVSRSPYRGVTISAAALGPVTLHLAPVGRLLVIATSEARIKDILDRHGDGGTSGSLRSAPRYQRMLAEAPGTGTATTQIVVNVDHLIAALAAQDPGNAPQLHAGLQYVGLADLEGLTTVARVDGEGVTATTSVNFTNSERRGVARLCAKGPPAKFGALDFAPRDTIYVNCGTFDTKELYAVAQDLGGMGTAMVQGRFEQMFGLRLREDLLDLIGPEAAFIVSPNKGLIPDLTIVCESPDAKRLEKNLLAILSRLPWPKGTGVSTFKIRDVEVHAVPLGHRKLAEFPLAPTFGVVDGRLVISLFPLSFQRILAVRRGDRASLASNRDFAKLRERVPADAMGLSYLDLRRVFELVYETAVPFLQAIPNPSGLTNLYEFPDVDVFSKYLFGRIAWRTADDRGLKWQSYGALDTSGFLLSMVVGGAVALFYTTAREEEAVGLPPGHPEVERDVEARLCKRRVRFLKARILWFEQEKGRLPEKLDDLRAKWVDPETFLVPGAAGRNYAYYGPAGKGAVLLHGYPNGADGRLCVVTKDMKMLRVTEEELKKLFTAKGDAEAR